MWHARNGLGMSLQFELIFGLQQVPSKQGSIFTTTPNGIVIKTERVSNFVTGIYMTRVDIEQITGYGID